VSLAQPPIETDAIQVTPPARVAAGLKSVLKAAEFISKEPGLVRAIAALSQSQPIRWPRGRAHESQRYERMRNAGALLDITSHFHNAGNEELRVAPRFVVVPYEIPRRCVATYFPEANVLVPIGSVALRSNTPTSKAVIVSFAPSRCAAPL
jgi:hypothetical protein